MRPGRFAQWRRQKLSTRLFANVHQNLTPMRAASLSGNDCGGKDEVTVVSRLQHLDRSDQKEMQLLTVHHLK